MIYNKGPRRRRGLCYFSKNYANLSNMNPVILCDKDGNEIGQYDKLQAHVENKLHKAFSIMIYNTSGQLLLHKRADVKYHTPGLWTNACCSHDIPGEDITVTVSRRLQEEMGFTCKLQPQFTFLYQAELDNELFEYELDTVYTGIYDGPIDVFNPDEVSDARWMNISDVQSEIVANPEQFTPWFKILMQKMHS